MRYPRFTLRDFLWFAALAGVALAWCGDRYERSRKSRQISELHREELRRVEAVRDKLAKELLKAGYAITISGDDVAVEFVPKAAPQSSN